MTGYALGLDGDTGRDGQPVWYGGGKLAADLTLPKLRARWDPARAGAGPRPGSAERNATWDYAARTAAEASAAIGDLRGTDPAAASDIAWATADVLRAAAAALGSPASGQAADAYDRAARQPWGRPPPPSPAGRQRRSAARLRSAAGHVSRDRPLAHLALVVRLAALAEAVGELRRPCGPVRASRRPPGSGVLAGVIRCAGCALALSGRPYIRGAAMRLASRRQGWRAG